MVHDEISVARFENAHKGYQNISKILATKLATPTVTLSTFTVKKWTSPAQKSILITST